MMRRAVLFFLCLATMAIAETTRELWDRGAAAYQAGEIYQALASWEKALAQNPQNAALTQKITAVRAELHHADVVRVVDGDTIIVNLDGVQESVRLIGVDTPETVHPNKPVEAFAKEASDYLKGRIEGQKVALTYRGVNQERDRYFRLLAYVYLLPAGDFINKQIVSEGYGHAYLDYPFAYMDEFRQAERQAREAKKGLWADGAASPGDNPAGDGQAGAIQEVVPTVLRTSPQAFMAGGRTMVPFRAILEWMGATVGFDSGLITASLQGKMISLRVGQRQAMVNGQAVNLDAPPVIKEATTFVPLRFVVEGLGAAVTWDNDIYVATVTAGDRVATVPVALPEYQPSWGSTAYTTGVATGSTSPPSADRPAPVHRPSTSRPSTTTTPQVAAGNCPQGGNHTAGKRDRNGRLHCAKCGRFM